MQPTQTNPHPPQGREILGGLLRLAWGLANGLVIGGFIGVLTTMTGTTGLLSPVGLLLSLSLVWLTTAVHETGHALASTMGGYRFLMMSVWPLLLTTSQRGLRLRRNPGQSFFNGFFISVAPDDRPRRWRMAWKTLGGPLANLAFGFALLVASIVVAAVLVDGGDNTPGPVVVLVLTGILSVWMGLFNLVPLRAQGMPSDGARLWALLRNAPETQGWADTECLSGQALAGIRPRDWDPELVARLLAPRSGEADTSALLNGYYWALDRGEAEQAGALLDRAVERTAALPPFARAGVLTEAAFYTARYRHDAAAAGALLTRAKGGFVHRYDRLRAEAAVCLAEGDNPRAASAAAEGLDASWEATMAGFVTAERDWLEDIRREAAARAGAPGAAA